MTDYSDLSGERVVSGSLMMPRYGAWVADVALAVQTTLPSPVTLTVGTLSLVGAVVRAGAYAGSRAYRLVGGYGGWRRSVGARAYANAAGVSSAMVLGDLAAEVGEVVAINAPEYLGASYVRTAGPASTTLRQIAATWWVDGTGTTQVDAVRSTSLITSAFLPTHRDGAAGLIQIATEAEADWMPGRTFTSPLLNGTIHQVQAARFAWGRDGVARVEVVTR
jgi:hypothetical protein